MEKVIINDVDLSKGIKKLVAEGAIVNCTSHPVNIFNEGEVITIMPSGVEPRCSTKIVEVAPGFIETEYGDVEGLPEEESGKLLIVSALVRTREPLRFDLIGPDTSQQGKVVSSEGKLLGVKGFTL